MECEYIVGIDEAGRGPVAGAVTVGAVLLPLNFKKKFFEGIRDSKQLSKKQRERWFNEIRSNNNIRYAACFTGARRIDRSGIREAIKLALKRCLDRIKADPDKCVVLLDGALKAPPVYKNQRTIIKGDEKIPVISLASIVAKVFRDRQMARCAKRYPKYGFEKHKGYGTKAHLRAIQKHGACEIHRRSFLNRFMK